MMIYLNEKKKIINPIIDKILTNPLKFIQNNTLESSSDMKSDKFIVLSNTQLVSTTADSLAVDDDAASAGAVADNVKKQKSTKRALSLADAVAAYTGKQYGKNKKRKVKKVVDSEDEGEEVADDNQIVDASNNNLKDDIDEKYSSSNDIFESANEFQSSSDSDKSDVSYQGVKSEKSESDSLSEEPEDLNQLKQDLKNDEIEAENKQDQTHAEEEDKKNIEEPTPQIDFKQYYDFNENPNDRGSNDSKRINKSYPKKYLNKKPLGLLNQGVTCYMNTAIQSMIHIPAISNYLDDINAGKYSKILPPRSVSFVLAELAHRIWNFDNNKKKYIHPKKIINRLEDINCMMSEWQQEDSHEYFMSLMSRLQEDSTPKGVKLNESIIYDIFGGLLNQVVVCQKCKTKSITKQEFYDLSLGFKKSKGSYTIEKSIKDFFNSETIKQDKDNQKSGYFCEKCKENHTATKISTIDIAPEYLTVHLKRFKFNGSQSMKMKQSIKYSNIIDLSDYTTSKIDAKYKLISIISHEGRSLSSGHYISHCLQPDKTWYTYDDEYINKINEFQALNDPSAYVLIYTKLTPKK